MGQANSHCPAACCEDGCRASDWCNKEKNTVKVNPSVVAELNTKNGIEHMGKDHKVPECCENQDSIPEVVPETVVDPKKDQPAENTDSEDCTQPGTQPAKLKDCTGGVWASDEEEQLQEAIQASLREQGVVRQEEMQAPKPTEEPEKQEDLDALLAASLAYEEEEAAATENQWQQAQIQESKKEEPTTADDEADHERAVMVQSFLRSNGFKDGVNALIRKPINKTRPLHVAVRKADSWLVESLMWSGADPSLVDGKNQTPLDLAKKLNQSPQSGNSQKPIIAILEAAN